MTEANEERLAGRRVLVVEDEYFIVDDLVRALRRLGAKVVGPAPDRDEALALLSAGERIDLDVNLRCEQLFHVAMRCGIGACRSCSRPAMINPPCRPRTGMRRAGRSVRGRA